MFCHQLLKAMDIPRATRFVRTLVMEVRRRVDEGGGEKGSRLGH